MRKTFRVLTALSAGGLLAACAATPDAAKPALAHQAWDSRVQVIDSPNALRLAAHPNGLSANQRAALKGFAAEWLAAEGGVVTVQTPGDAAPAAALAVREALLEQGIDARLTASAPAGDGPAVIVVSFVDRRAVGPRCGQSWGSLTATRDNEAYENFGCAVSANIAVQVADPRDLQTPRALTPPDAARRDQAFGRYRSASAAAPAPAPAAGGAGGGEGESQVVN